MVERVQYIRGAKNHIYIHRQLSQRQYESKPILLYTQRVWLRGFESFRSLWRLGVKIALSARNLPSTVKVDFRGLTT